MADQYVPLPVKSKNTNDLSVQLRNPANSAFMGDATTPLVTTVNNATIAVTQSTSPWVVAGNVASGAADSGNPIKVGGVFNTVLPTLTNGQRGDVQLTAKGTQIITLADAGGNLVTVTANRLLVDGSGVTQPVSGTFWQATQPVSGTVTANQGTAAAGASAWPVTMTTTGDVVVKPGDSTNNAIRVNVVAGGSTNAPTTPTRSYQTISALAISTRTAINFPEIGTTLTARLAQLEVASSVTCKWELFTFINGVESATPLLVSFTTAANPSLIWSPPHPNYVTIAASAGADNFRLYVTNLDNALAADVYSTIFYDIS